MLDFLIHFTLPDGSEDSISLSGETIEEIQAKAATELKKRGGENAWSEELSP